MKKNTRIALASATVLILLLLIVYSLWIKPTRIAFLNYQVIQLGEISKANEGEKIRISELLPENCSKAGRYDMLFINGMGLRITEEQRTELKKAAEKGLPVISTMVTNPANNINSLEEEDSVQINAYLEFGGRMNYRNMLRYVRKEIDGKKISAPEYEEAVKRRYENFYHADFRNPANEDLEFRTLKDYLDYLKENGIEKDQRPAVIITGQMGDATDVVRALEETGNIVYPVRSLHKIIRNGQIDTIAPSAVINMAHGRLGDGIVRYLEKADIPLFAPLNVNGLVSSWENDPMGMFGGFMSQSIVTPEIDGAIRPYVIFGNYIGEDGLQQLRTIPGRLEEFVESVNRYLSLQRKPEKEKKIAIYYFKGPGQNAMTAAGMDVVPSLYNLLKEMKKAGYQIDLPSSPAALEKLIQKQGKVFGTYAEGAISDFMEQGDPAWIDAETFGKWSQHALSAMQTEDLDQLYGPFPGSYMTRDGRLALARIDLGHVVLLPQPAAGSGDNEFQMVHGTKSAPPYNYVCAYLWAKEEFQADAFIHFGTHGSLEFTPEKQVALCSNDWPDRLIGAVPHFYIYTIGNVGESMMAKRRSYSGIVSYLTPPFMESGVSGIYAEIAENLDRYNKAAYDDDTPDPKAVQAAAEAVKKSTVASGIHRDLELDSSATAVWGEKEMLKVENFYQELAKEKVTGRYYTMGVPYEEKMITSTVRAMCIEPLAYGMMGLDKARGTDITRYEKQKAAFNSKYGSRAEQYVDEILKGSRSDDAATVCRIAGIGAEKLAESRKIYQSVHHPVDLMSMMMNAGSEMKSGEDKSTSSMMAQIGMSMFGRKKSTPEEIEFAEAVSNIDIAVTNVRRYRKLLRESPQLEMQSLLSGLDGGYIAPSPGGDAIANPNTLPTGRNLFAVNAEAAPTRTAWEKGKKLAENTIALYQERHNDSIPRKVSYTLWSSEFIETEGATIAQILYLLGVEPVYDSFGRVTDIRLIPSEVLGRPRIDVVVQTSGQLRDLAASRLFLIDRAVKMAAAATDEYQNLVAEGLVESERKLVESGITPKEAREMASHRVFGGINGNYGTGIQEMVQSSGRWEDKADIADTYLNNMGAYYGSVEEWEKFTQHAFEAALVNTDAVIQPRQSNTWGALSLDHVYEFMGGLNLAVSKVTGKDPDAYFSDYRNRNNMRMQELRESIGVESRTSIFNPAFIREKMKGGATDASFFAETVQNMFGWDVMKTSAIDDEMWNEVYDIYVQDKFDLDIRKHFEKVNPAALEEMSAVMMESSRKGMWKATPEQLSELADLHTELVKTHGPSCSGHVCDNLKLQNYIADHADSKSAGSYKKSIRKIREAAASSSEDGMVMKKEPMNQEQQEKTAMLSNIAVWIVALLFIGGTAVLIIRRRRKMGA